jgi:nitrogen fixation/metabolism regulation signal transduction histidine kinase
MREPIHQKSQHDPDQKGSHSSLPAQECSYDRQQLHVAKSHALDATDIEVDRSNHPEHGTVGQFANSANGLVRRTPATVMSEIEVAVFDYDGEQRLRLVNRAGERLLHRPIEQLLGRSASELGLDDCLQPGSRTLQKTFPGAVGRWGIRRSTFREGGLPHQLLVIADLSRELREEERVAWQRLVRVLGHELNNSLAPIRAIAGSLDSMLKKEPRPHDWEDDLDRGLTIISSRAEALSRFMAAYARLASSRPRSVRRWRWVHGCGESRNSRLACQ